MVYKKIAREYELVIQSFYDSHECNVINSNNLSILYSCVNSKLSHTSSIPPLMKTDGSLAINDRDKCNVLNDYFASVFTIDNGVLPVFHPKVSCVQAYQQVEFTHSKVLCALKCLPSKYSRTPDGFPAGFLKSVASAIAFPLSRLFTMSMDCGCIPQGWKQAIVCPIFKKIPVNHLVRFLLPVFVAKMESIVYKSMVFFLRSNSLISKDQFVPGVLLVPNC